MKITLSTILTILFVTLKLTGNIDWSWVWVLSPLWISATLYALMLVLVIVLAACANRVILKKNDKIIRHFDK